MAKSFTAAAIRALKIGKRLKGGDGLFAENVAESGISASAIPIQ